MKKIKTYNQLFENRKLDLGDLLIDSFKKYFEKNIDNLSVDGWGDYTIFSDDKEELFTLYKNMYTDESIEKLDETLKEFPEQYKIFNRQQKVKDFNL